MKKYTQMAIISTFSDMLEEMPFEKITVKELVKRCRLSHNTFYYHYQDIYQLLGHWLGERMKDCAAGGCVAPADRSVGRLFRLFLEKADSIRNIYRKMPCEMLDRYLFSLTRGLFGEHVRALAADRNVPQELLDELAELCRYTFIGLLCEALWSGEGMSGPEMGDRLSALLDRFVLSVSLEHQQDDSDG